jgi:hypothetical protein
MMLSRRRRNGNRSIGGSMWWMAVVVASCMLIMTFVFQSWMTIHRQLELLSQHYYYDNMPSSSSSWMINMSSDNEFSMLLTLSTKSSVKFKMTKTMTTKDTTAAKRPTSPLPVFQPSSSSRPRLSDLIGDRYENITGNVQWLLDFAMIGHSKCGTTTFLEWMKRNPSQETLVLPDERYDLQRGRPARLVERLYQLITDSSDSSDSNSTKTTASTIIHRGYKSPNDIQDRRSMRYLQSYFPTAKLIVGIRHPILWFESLYNFRIQNIRISRSDSQRIQNNQTTTTTTMRLLPHANRLIGACQRNMKHTCTDSGLFHVHLAKLGKTNLTRDEIEGESLHPYRRWILDERGNRPPRMPHSIFLYEVNQLQSPPPSSHRGKPSGERQLLQQHQHRSLQFRRDVQTFLGLQHELPPVPHALPGKTWDDPYLQAFRDSQKIRICKDEFAPVRKRLLRQAQEASIWIRQYFLNAPDVVVSSRDYMEELLERWMHDPCVNDS